MKRHSFSKKRPSHSPYESYQSALKGGGFKVRHIDGDGNCLFRSVAHQVYGDDRYHKIVRQKCMDYMELESEYFCNYIDDGKKGLQRYIQWKRRDGCWGDHLEIAAMCELYDRPAEIWSGRGNKTLQTPRDHPTHNANASASSAIPVIRLSYYGGFHYDSIIGNNHSKFLLTSSPGTAEDEKIRSSKIKLAKQIVAEREKKLKEKEEKLNGKSDKKDDEKNIKKDKKNEENGKTINKQQPEVNSIQKTTKLVDKTAESKVKKELNGTIDERRSEQLKNPLSPSVSASNHTTVAPSSSSQKTSKTLSTSLLSWLTDVREINDDDFLNEVGKKVFSLLNPHKKSKSSSPPIITRERLQQELNHCLLKIRDVSMKDYLFVEENLSILFNYSTTLFISKNFAHLFHQHISLNSNNSQEVYIIKAIPIAMIIREHIMKRRKRLTKEILSLDPSNSHIIQTMRRLLAKEIISKPSPEKASNGHTEVDTEEGLTRACFLLHWLLPHFTYKPEGNDQSTQSMSQSRDLFVLLVKVFGRFEFGSISNQTSTRQFLLSLFNEVNQKK